MAEARHSDAHAPQRIIEIDDIRLQVRESGSGRPLVVLTAGDGALIDPLLKGLAEDNHVFVVDVAGAGAMTAHDLAGKVSQGLVRLGLDRFSMIGISRGAPLALAQASFTPRQIDKLILVSPPPLSGRDEELRAGLPKVDAPTLVLVGTRDRSGSLDTARLLKEKLRACHLLLIYDADEKIAVDRQDVCLAPIGEFLDRGLEFVVCHESQIIHR
jgi:pimeloyl-ACP methyl ester carboxylesterase